MNSPLETSTVTIRLKYSWAMGAAAKSASMTDTVIRCGPSSDSMTGRRLATGDLDDDEKAYLGHPTKAKQS